MHAHISGRLVFNTGELIIDAATAGLGLAWIPNDLVADRIASGRLIRVLEDWAVTYPGYCLYYASRRASLALVLSGQGAAVVAFATPNECKGLSRPQTASKCQDWIAYSI